MHRPKYRFEARGTKSRTVLGLAPGSRRTGYGVVRIRPEGFERVASGVFRLEERRPFAERLPQLRNELVEVIRSHRPDEAVLETCFVARSARSALVLGHVRGVLLLLCLEAGMEVFEYSPAEMKRSVTGAGGASKQQVAAMVPRLLLNARSVSGQDESDALGIAYCHISRPIHARARPMQRFP